MSINESTMTVAHYASAMSGGGNTKGKFVTQTLTFAKNKPNKPCDLLDFDKGVFIVTTDAARRDKREAEERWTERMNESAYDTNINNCEHIINDILYKKLLTNQADTKPFLTHLVGYIVNDIKIVIVLYTILICIMYPMTRHWRCKVELQLLGGAILIDFANANNGTFDVPDVHDGIIYQVDDLKKELEEIKNKMKQKQIIFNENTMANITTLLTNPLVSKMAWDTKSVGGVIFPIYIIMEVFLDFSLSFYFFTFGHTPLTRYNIQIPKKDNKFCVILNSTMTKALLELIIVYILMFLQKIEYFFTICIILSFISRFVFTVLIGWLFDREKKKVVLGDLKDRYNICRLCWVFYVIGFIICLAVSVFAYS